jgi:hypothetical protein
VRGWKTCVVVVDDDDIRSAWKALFGCPQLQVGTGRHSAETVYKQSRTLLGRRSGLDELDFEDRNEPLDLEPKTTTNEIAS